MGKLTWTREQGDWWTLNILQPIQSGWGKFEILIVAARRICELMTDIREKHLHIIYTIKIAGIHHSHRIFHSVQLKTYTRWENSHFCSIFRKYLDIKMSYLILPVNLNEQDNLLDVEKSDFSSSSTMYMLRSYVIRMSGWCEGSMVIYDRNDWFSTRWKMNEDIMVSLNLNLHIVLNISRLASRYLGYLQSLHLDGRFQSVPSVPNTNWNYVGRTK